MRPNNIISRILANRILMNSIKATLAFLALLFLTRIIMPENTFESAFRPRWRLCLTFLEQGALYSDQPYCEQGPVFFIFLYIFKLLFGMENIEIVSNFLNLIIGVIIIFFAAKIVKKEINKDYFWFILIFYSIFIYPLIIARNLHISLITLLFLSAFYILYHTKLKSKEHISGLLFALSIFTNLTIVPYILVVVIFYSFNIKKLDFGTLKGVLASRPLLLSGFKRIFILLLPFLIISIFFKIIFPKIFLYILNTATQPLLGLSFIDMTSILISEHFTIIQSAHYLVFVFLFFAFIKKRDVYTSTAFLGFIAIFLVVSRHFLPILRYMTISYILFIVVFLIASNNIKTRLHKNIFIYAILIILIAPHSAYIYFEFQRNQLRELVEYPLNFIPEQDGYILAEYYTLGEYKKFFSNYYPYNLDKLEIVTTPTGSGADYVGVERYTGINATLWISENIEKPIENRNKKIAEKINNGEYSLIIFGPPEWKHLSSLHDKVKTDVMYCPIGVPFLNYFGEPPTEARSFLEIVFRHHKDCFTMAKAMRAYYTEHFESICKKDQNTANWIKEFMGDINLDINKICTKGGDFVRRYKKVKEMFIRSTGGRVE